MFDTMGDVVEEVEDDFEYEGFGDEERDIAYIMGRNIILIKEEVEEYRIHEGDLEEREYFTLIFI